MANETALLAFERSLRGLLAQLESPTASSHDLAAAVEHNRRAFEALRTLAGTADSESEETVRARCRGTVGLLRQWTERELLDTERRLALALVAGRALAAQTDAADTYHPCDVAG